VDVQLIRDKASGRSKGFGYVEFEELEAVPKALLLNGQKFCMKHPVRWRLSSSSACRICCVSAAFCVGGLIAGTRQSLWPFGTPRLMIDSI
jgi:RNA recognition motif-containing protein